MAENVPAEGNNLDDFFAKKDKTKKKAKSKFTVDDILQAKEDSEEKSKKKKSKKKEKDASRSDQALGGKIEGDEEWLEVEEETEKDYTGLRIQNLQISGKTDEERQESGSLRTEEGEDGETHETSQGPWKPVQAATPSPAPTPAAETAAEPAKDTPKSTGKYVPPAMRRAQAETPQSAGLAPVRGGRVKKTAPNVNSQEDFPTLGTVVEPCEGPAFEKARGGARQMEDPASQHTKLSLGNKFTALNSEET